MRIKTFASFLPLLAILAGCGPSGDTTTSGAAPTSTPLPTSAKAETRDLVGYVLFPGVVDIPADATADVHPPYRATVAKVDVKIGQRVNRGETLIELNMPDQKVALQQAQDNYKTAQTAYTSADAQYGGAVRDAKHRLDEAQAAERAARTAAAQSGDATQVDQATQQRQAAEEALLQARAAVKVNMLPYQQQLDAAKTTLDDAKSGFKQSLVKAPLGGTVVDIKAAPGQEIGTDAKEVVAKIVDYAAVTIRATIDDSQFKLAERGTKVVFALADRSKPPVDGVVRKIRDVPSTTNGAAQKELTIDFKNEDVLVGPGVAIRWVGIKTGDVKGVIAVPNGALDHDATGKPIVRVLDGQDWKPVVVETGVSDGDWTEIKSGVKAGDTVQVKGQTAS